MKKELIFIYGPTAVGKSNFVLDLAQQINGEVVNLDVYQMYTPLTIGTAKPDWRNELVPHHLFDMFNEPGNCTVVTYRAMLLEKAEELWARGKVPLVVGGSGFYLKSVLFPPLGEGISEQELDALYPSGTNIWNALHAIDPQRAQAIGTHDPYRARRALSLWHATGTKPSSYVPVYDPPAPYHIIFLSRERDELYERINKRVEQMVHQGWLNEVEQLRGTPWEAFLYEKRVIGYNELLDYCNGSRTQDALKQAIMTIQKRTRNYAKRQFTFWRMLEKQAHASMAKNLTKPHGTTETVNLTFTDHTLYLKRLLERLLPL